MAKISILRCEVTTEELTAMVRVALDAQAAPDREAQPASAGEATQRNAAVLHADAPAALPDPRAKAANVKAKRRSPQKAPKPRLDERVCDHCGKTYYPRRADQRFCCPECNKGWHNAHDYTAKKNSEHA